MQPIMHFLPSTLTGAPLSLNNLLGILVYRGLVGLVFTLELVLELSVLFNTDRGTGKAHFVGAALGSVGSETLIVDEGGPVLNKAFVSTIVILMLFVEVVLGRE